MDDVFGTQPAQQEQVPQGETQAEQQPPEQSAQPQPGEQGAAPPAADTTRHVPLEALEAERKGRQDWKEKAIRAEAELEQFRNQQRQAQQQQPQDPVQTLQTLIVNERFNISEDLVRQTHQDVDEVVGVFMEAAKQNPALAAQMHAHRSPWKFAYDEGKRLKFASEIGNDPEAYRKKVRAEIEAELRGQTGSQPSSSPQSQQPAAQPLPQSLAGARSAGARGNTFTGPTPMESIFPN